MRSWTFRGLVAALVLIMWSGVLHAQTQDPDNPRIELGAVLASATLSLEGHTGASVGIPAASFGVLGPGVYTSVFVGSHVAIEPQLSLLWVWSGGTSTHIVNFTTELEGFARPVRENSPYIFAAAGLVDVSGATVMPRSYGGGIGFRFRLGDRVVVRTDGRFVRVNRGIGNQVIFGVSLGGSFGGD